jgi:hypothetical protein
MLLSKLRVVFESASSELELWNRATSAQVDSQLRERRKGFKHRRESLERIQSAGGELEQSLAQLEAQDQRLVQQVARLNELAEALREHACAAPLGADFDGAFLHPSTVGAIAPNDQGVDIPLFDDVRSGRRATRPGLSGRTRIAGMPESATARRRSATASSPGSACMGETRCRGRTRATRTASGSRR